jgi:hypothetical protein
MRAVLAVFASFAITLLVPVAHAEDRPRVTYGHGAASCGAWIAARKPYGKDQAVMVSWVLGYVSAAGVFSTGGLPAVDSDGLASFMDNYCRSHPLEPINGGAMHLVRHLAGFEK